MYPLYPSIQVRTESHQFLFIYVFGQGWREDCWRHGGDIPRADTGFLGWAERKSEQQNLCHDGLSLNGDNVTSLTRAKNNNNNYSCQKKKKEKEDE